MSLCIYNKRWGMEIGYKGFERLRCDIADLLYPEFGELYKEWISHKIDDEIGNKQLEKLYDDGKLTDAADPVIQFLFKPDHKTELTKEQCEAVYTLIKDFDNNKDYSLLGATSPATFALFKKIFETSVRYGVPVYWN